MNVTLCGCQQTLWTTVDNPVDNSAGSRAHDSMPIKEINLFNCGEVVVALVHACDLLAARMDAIEIQMAEVIGLLTAPLTQEERIDRIREIQARLTDPQPAEQP